MLANFYQKVFKLNEGLFLFGLKNWTDIADIFFQVNLESDLWVRMSVRQSITFVRLD